MKAGQGVRSSIVGRGAAGNPKNRFEKIEVEPEPRGSDAEEPGPETVYLRDASRSIIARNDSPDLGFDISISINPYRGCSQWVHLLLRSSGTRVPGALSRTGFREQDPGKRRRPRATTQTALISSLEAKGTLRQRRRRLLPTHRKEAPPHAPLPRNPCGVPQPRRHIYQEPPRHPRYGPLLQARPAPSRGGNHLADHPGR